MYKKNTKLFYALSCLLPLSYRIKKILLIMKFTTLFLFIALMEVSAASHGQKVTISGRNISLGQVLSEIRAQTGYGVLIVTTRLKTTRKLSLNLRNASLKEVLDKITENAGLSYSIEDKTIVIRQQPAGETAPEFRAVPAPILISGKVTDENGQPLQGVTVTARSTGKMVVTNAQGAYKIEAEAGGDLLTFSYVGYLTYEVKADKGGTINVILKEHKQEMDEIVVVGYGTQNRTSVTGAVATVDSKLMTDRPVTNVVNALQGTAPGLIISRTDGQPGQEGWSMNIRGLTSLSGSNSPLVIIDGVPGDISSINPNDIENISILQDAAAASIYGAKAGAGVVLVTTKEGKSNKKPKVEMSNIYTVRKPYAKPEMISSGEQALLQNYAQQNTNGNTPFSDQQIKWMNDPDTNYVWNTATKAYDWYYNYNLADMLMRNNSSQDNANVSVSGLTNQSSYFFSFGYVGQKGVFKTGPDNYDRYNARINYNTRITSKFSFDSRVSYAYQITESPQPALGTLLYNIYQIRSARNPIWVPGD
ncbi:MAG: SusC/RagA family TonB-linked outer membrane protein, partial [Niabella sp.]